MFSYFSMIYGLVTRADSTSENGGLFLAEYLTLKKIKNIEITKQDLNIYVSKMRLAKKDKGLYLRSMNHQNRDVSHDEIGAMIIGSKILNTYHANDIISYLIKNLGNYPAIGNNKFYHPANYYAWLLITDKFTAFIFAPLYTLNLIISSIKSKNNTSSKIIYMVDLHLMKDLSWYSNILWKFFVWRMKSQYGEFWIQSLFDIYFASEDKSHPLVELSRGI